MFKRLQRWANRPYVSVTAVSVGVVVGTIASIFAGTVNLLATPLVSTGCLAILWLAWSKKPDWSGMFRERTFWGGIALIVAGNIVASLTAWR